MVSVAKGEGLLLERQAEGPALLDLLGEAAAQQALAKVAHAWRTRTQPVVAIKPYRPRAPPAKLPSQRAVAYDVPVKEDGCACCPPSGTPCWKALAWFMCCFGCFGACGSCWEGEAAPAAGPQAKQVQVQAAQQQQQPAGSGAGGGRGRRVSPLQQLAQQQK